MAGKLTIKGINALKPSDKTTRHFDGSGLYIEVTKAGGKYWRMKYRFAGKEKRLAIGTYPEVSLADARKIAAAARQQLIADIDPSQAKQEAKRAAKESADSSFQAVATEWLETVYRHKVVESHYIKGRRRLETKAFPYIGKRPISEIKPAEVLSVLNRISAAGTYDTVKRVRILISQIYRYAIGAGRAESDPTEDLKGTVSNMEEQKQGHHPAIIEPAPLAQLLRAIDGYSGHPVLKTALTVQSMVFVRPGELRHARWANMDLAKAEWTFTLSKQQKDKEPRKLTVPLPSQAVTLLTTLRDLTSNSEFVFPTPRTDTRPFSENGLKAALDSIGYKGKHTAHGFRATARTILDEELRYPPHIIEQQLGHIVKDANGRAYNRTAHLEQRREMLQHWANYLDELREGEAI